MPITIKKYPTAYTNTDTWTNPGNMISPPDAKDGLCGSKTTLTVGWKYCYLSGYGFNIPANATIISEYACGWMWCKSLYGTPVVAFDVIYNGINQGPSGSPSPHGSCADCWENRVKLEYLLQPFIPLADLNAENFTTRIGIYTGGGIATGYCDAVYIEVTYTVPSAVTIGDGLTWITAMKKFKDLTKPRFPQFKPTRIGLLKNG